MQYNIKNINLSEHGKKRINWASQDMPVLAEIKKRFSKTKPLKDKKLSACLHVTAETANLMITLKAGGVDVVLCASNPLSTQDDVAASLVKDFKIPVFAIYGENNKSYYKNLHSALKHGPNITMDDGADLITLLHSEYKNLIPNILASMEETTTGIIRLKALEKQKKLRLPIIAVNNAKTKNLFDNRYGTGQSTIDGIIRATDILLAGKNVVVAGYGWCGRGFAMRARGMGAKVIVTEVDEIKALEAVMDGFQVMPMKEAAKIGDLFCTLTGNTDVIREEHFKLMKDKAIVCNSGHFDVEINIPDLKKLSYKINKNIRNNVDEYVLKSQKSKVKSQKLKMKSIYLLCDGRLVNLAAAEGHPACVMDMSFATQALVAEYVVNQNFKNQVYNVPTQIEQQIAQLKLKSMGLNIDKLTVKQRKYLESWETGT